MSGPGALGRGPALCVGARRSLYWDPALLASGPAAPCVGARCSLSRVGAEALRSFPKCYFPSAGLALPSCLKSNNLYIGAQSSLRRGPALCLLGPGALCIGARRFVSGPGGLCVGARRFVCRGPALYLSGPGALCFGARGSASAPALFISGPGALSIGLRRSLSAYIWSPNYFYIGARHSSISGAKYYKHLFKDYRITRIYLLPKSQNFIFYD